MSSTTLTPAAPVAPVPKARRDRRSGATVQRRFLPLLPAVLLLLLFFAGPVLWSCYAAFTDQALSGPGAQHPQFIGLDNFRRMWNDPTFIQSIVLTIVFVVGSAVIGQNVLGLIIALLLRRSSRVVQASVSLVVVGAWVMPEIVAAFCWYAFLNRGGSLNHWLHSIGLSQNWLYTAPMFAVILANVWRGTAFSMMVYSAALSDIPPEV
jgi:multiple sugar transport system permease protein